METGIIAGVLDRLFERRASLANPDAFLVGAFGGTETESGLRIDEATALKYAAVWACVRVLAESVASLPLPLYKRLPRGKERLTGHPLYTLLHDQPNPEMTSFVFRETMMSHAVTWGNAYAEIERDRAGRPIALWPLLPDRTWPERKNKVLRYVTRVNNTAEVPLRPDQVFHIPGLSWNGLKGYSPIAIHREAIGLGMATEQFGSKFFGSGARPSGVIEYPGKFATDDDRTNFRKQWQNAYGGLTNAQRTAVLEQGMKWSAISIPPDDAQFLETRVHQLREVARIFRVQPHLIGDLENATFSNIEHQSLEFVTHTLRPWLVRWEQAITQRLVMPSERSEVFAEFVIDGLLRGDIAARYSAYQVGRQNGWLSANDVRELENMNPLPGDQGDIFMVPLNMVPAEQLTEGAAGSDVSESPFERSDSGAVEERSAQDRRRAQRAHLQLLKAAAGRAIAREVNAGRRAVKTAYGKRGDQAFIEWLEWFYPQHRDYIAKQMLPVLMALAEAVGGAAARDVTVDDPMTPELEKFIKDYADALAIRMTTSSDGQLRRIIADTPAEDVEAALDQRLVEWDETRPAKIASREAVQAGSAVAKHVWAAAGVQVLVWRTNGPGCPLCQEMSGRTAEVTKTFAGPGDQINPTGPTAPLDVKQRFGHPPLHEGCDCTIAPG